MTTTPDTKTRQSITMTAEDAAVRAMNWVELAPENIDKTQAELVTLAKNLLARMIRSGVFVIA
jgi:hypothetical protein